MDKISIQVELEPPMALAFAQFLKRAGHSNYREKATSDAEAYEMLFAGEAVRRSLAEAGIAPR